MTESCFVYKRMANCLGHVLVLSCYVTPPPCYPRLVIIFQSVSPVLVINVPLFNPLVFAVLCRFIVKLCDSCLNGRLNIVILVSILSSVLSSYKF